MATLTLNTTAVPASLASLNMSNVKKPTQQTAVQMRRNKLSKQLWEQVQLATALANGSSFAPIRVRTVKDKLTGERKTVEQPKRIKPWWFTAEDGSVCLQVRYGVQVLPFANAVASCTCSHSCLLSLFLRFVLLVPYLSSISNLGCKRSWTFCMMMNETVPFNIHAVSDLEV